MYIVQKKCDCDVCTCGRKLTTNNSKTRSGCCSDNVQSRNINAVDVFFLPVVLRKHPAAQKPCRSGANYEIFITVIINI